MVLQAKIGLALLSIGAAGLWYYSKKEESPETIDTDYQDLSSSLASGKTVLSLPKSTANTTSLKADATNSLSTSFIESPKTNIIESALPIFPRRREIDCEGIGCINQQISGIGNLPVML